MLDNEEADTPPLRRLAVAGATGDLARRMLMPALARLVEAGRLPHGFSVVALDRHDLDAQVYRDVLGSALDEHAADVGAAGRDALLEATTYRRADVTATQDLAAALPADDEPLAVYLALPPAVFESAVRALRACGLPPGSRLVVEKPFGEDLAGARRLNARLAEYLPEAAVHRVDHFLGQQTVQNLLGLRFANRVFEPLWTREHIDSVEIVWDETLTLEGRAGYYDATGALRDMVQNHLLQLLALVAIEPPTTLSERDLRDRKLDVLRAVRRPPPERIAAHSVRGRYTAGRIAARSVPDYAREPGVDPQRGTETFAAVTLFVDNWRWAGVPFRLRTGKALAEDRHEIAVRFEPVAHVPFADGQAPRPNVLRLGLDPDVMALDVVVNGAGDPLRLEDATLRMQLAPQDVPAYGRVLLDVLAGDPTFTIRGDEAEEAWRIVEPLLDAWSRGDPPLHDYPAGSHGPSPSRG